MSIQSVSGQYVDVVGKRIFPAEIQFSSKEILAIIPIEQAPNQFILPGFINAHVHIESSMLVPAEFAKAVIPFGTLATVSDPHEIANVCGIAGIEYMIQNAAKSPLKVFFGAPSCVPATGFETSGAILNAEDLDRLFDTQKLIYLSEMMNYPGVVYQDQEVSRKLQTAKKRNLPIDGHAPGLSGEALKTYVQAGISTDHECTNLDEAIEKIKLGMKIQLREGSAAKNFDALFPLIDLYPDQVMLCTDDSHPDDLLRGHINNLVVKSIAKGAGLFNVLRACSLVPALHYSLPVGLLQTGDPADFIIVNDLKDFELQTAFIDGMKVYQDSCLLFNSSTTEVINQFKVDYITPADLKVKATGSLFRVIEAVDGDLVTQEILAEPHVNDGYLEADLSRDFLKIVVLNRYKPSVPVVGFIHRFGLKKGAVASSIAHDSHNIIAVGTNDEDLSRTINQVISHQGGIAVCAENEIISLPLPVAGLMSTLPVAELAEAYATIQAKLKEWGSTLQAPLMTLSFMALLVIPALKIGDKGLFDGKSFSFTQLQVES